MFLLFSPATAGDWTAVNFIEKELRGRSLEITS
jgi:hypothetical protein